MNVRFRETDLNSTETPHLKWGDYHVGSSSTDIQRLATATDYFLSVASWYANKNYPAPVSTSAKALSWLGAIKNTQDVILALIDISNFSDTGGLTLHLFGFELDLTDADPQDIVPQYLKFSEQTAYLHPLVLHNQAMIEELASLATVLAAERERRF